MAQVRTVTEFPLRPRPPATDAAMPLLLLGPSVRLGRARDEMLVLTPSNRVTEPDDPFRRIAAPARIDARDGFAGSEEIDRLAEAEQDGRDAAHVLAELDPRIAELTSDLLGGIDGLFTPLSVETDGPLLLTSPIARRDGSAGAAHVPAETVGRLRRAVSVARLDPPATKATPLLLRPEMRVRPAAALDEQAIRRMLTEIVREELSGAWGRKIVAEIREELRATA